MSKHFTPSFSKHRCLFGSLRSGRLHRMEIHALRFSMNAQRRWGVSFSTILPQIGVTGTNVSIQLLQKEPLVAVEKDPAMFGEIDLGCLW